MIVTTGSVGALPFIAIYYFGDTGDLLPRRKVDMTLKRNELKSYPAKSRLRLVWMLLAGLPIMVLIGIVGTAVIWTVGVVDHELTVLLAVVVPLLIGALVESLRYYQSRRRSPSGPIYAVVVVGLCYGAALGPFCFSELRCVSVHMLAAMGPIGVPGLSRALFDPNQSVFEAAVSHLEKDGGTAAADAIGACLAQRREDKFTFPAARALFRMGPEGVRVLDERLRYVEPGSYSAGGGLWRDMIIVMVVPEFPRESEDLIPALSELAMDNTASREDRVDTVVALGSIGPPAIAALESLAKLPIEGADYGHDRNTVRDIRDAATNALANLTSE